MVEVGRFVEELKTAGIGLFAGVPDSLLKSFCAHVTDTCGASHVITANEVGAVGLAAGKPDGDAELLSMPWGLSLLNSTGVER